MKQPASRVRTSFSGLVALSLALAGAAAAGCESKQEGSSTAPATSVAAPATSAGTRAGASAGPAPDGTYVGGPYTIVLERGTDTMPFPAIVTSGDTKVVALASKSGSKISLTYGSDDPSSGHKSGLQHADHLGDIVENADHSAAFVFDKLRPAGAPPNAASVPLVYTKRQ